VTPRERTRIRRMADVALLLRRDYERKARGARGRRRLRFERAIDRLFYFRGRCLEALNGTPAVYVESLGVG
jgi:hypothetical protein